MNTNLKTLFGYRTNQNLEDVMMIVGALSVCILFVMLIWAIYTLRQLMRERSIAWKRFHVLARRYTLDSREQAFMKRLLKKANARRPSRYLLEQDRFDKLANSIKKKRSADTHYLNRIREKLFGKALEKDEVIRSTHGLRYGTRLEIEAVKGSPVWGRVVDVDDSGLVVVLTDKFRSGTLRPGTKLDITAYIPKHEPLNFSTKVSSVIPGPRKMIVLAHSTYVVNAAEQSGPPYKKEVEKTLSKMYAPGRSALL